MTFTIDGESNQWVEENRKIHLRFSDGSTATTSDTQTNKSSIEIHNELGKTIVGAFFNEGDASWLAGYEYPDSSSVKVLEAGSSKPERPAMYARYVSQATSSYDSAYIEFKFEVLDANSQRVDKMQEVFAHAEGVTFYSSDAKDTNPIGSKTVADGFSSYTESGIVSFHMDQSDLANVPLRLFNGPRLIYSYDDTDLSRLSLSSGDWSSAFMPWTTDYTVRMLRSDNVTVTASVYDGATMTIGGIPAVDGQPIAVNQLVDESSVPIVVTSPDGARSKTYTIDIYYADPMNGLGTEASPYQIATADQLMLIRGNMGRDVHYELAGNIDLSGYASADSGRGWEPIGTRNAPFEAKLNGRGHTISNLTVNRPSEPATGLFGTLGSHARVEHVRLEGVNVIGGDSTGGLAGMNNGTIIHGAVDGTVSSGSNNSGGLVGYHTGLIERSHAVGTVSGSGAVGGLIGYQSSTGNVEDSYSAVHVSGDFYIGGLIGEDWSRSIARSYASGTVSANTSAHGHGLIGNGYDSGYFGVAEHSFYDSDKAGAIPDPLYARTTAQMQTESLYTDAGWNFEAIWEIDITRDYKYPTLRQAVFLPDAPQLTVAESGDGKVGLQWTSISNASGYKLYQSTESGVYSEPPTSVTGTVYESAGLTNGSTYYYIVRATNSAGDSVNSNEVSAVPLAGGGEDTGEGSGDDEDTDVTPQAPSGEADQPIAVELRVNGQAVKLGRITTASVGDRTETTIAIDTVKQEELLSAAGHGAIITIPFRSETDIAIGELTGQLVKSMEQRQAIVEIQTANATYKMPAQQINIEAIVEQFGTGVQLEDLKIQIAIAKPEADTIKLVEHAAEEGGFSLVVPPLNFTVKASYGDATIELHQFSAYVERMIALPDGIDPSQITTAVVIEPDGAIRHVPTRVVTIDGKHYAVVNSRTNSTYAVISHIAAAFKDIEGHWGKSTVNDMGSRFIVSGIGNGLYDPDRAITRAEFAAIIVRGLGLKLESGGAAFTDVAATAWHHAAVHTAHKFSMISGFGDDSFRPDENITREQAMDILARAMRVTGMTVKVSEANDELLAPFTDADSISAWAIDGVKSSLQAGLITGRGGSVLAPKAYVTRAEVAVMIQKLLIEAGLI